MKTAIANRIKTEARISARLFFLGFNHKPRNYSGRMLQIFENEFQAELFTLHSKKKIDSITCNKCGGASPEILGYCIACEP